MNRICITASLFTAVLAFGCSDTQPEPLTTGNAAGLVPGLASRLDVTATHEGDEHLFTLSSPEVPAGWTTIRFTNASHADHFVLLYRVPDAAITAAAAAGESLLDHWHQGVTVPFQEEFNPYVAGEIGYEAFVNNLVGAILGAAPWFFDPGAPPAGGPGLTAAGRTSETTVLLEPGTYILECYVKDGDEQFHSYNGMLEQLTVTEGDSRAREPMATAELQLSSGAGIQAPAMRPGKQTVAIRFLDQVTHEHLLGHNAQLVRLQDAAPARLEALAAWMDWRAPGALAQRAPEGTEFLGGTMELTAGGTAYFTVNLEPGTYAWIAEVPDPAGKNMLQTFQVPAARANR